MAGHVPPLDPLTLADTLPVRTDPVMVMALVHGSGEPLASAVLTSPLL
ncbi:hypothetical protein [Nocardia sp. NPDC049707]